MAHLHAASYLFVTADVRGAAQAIASAPASVEDYERFIKIVREAQQRDLDRDQVESRVAATPFAGIISLLPKDKALLVACLSLLVAVLTLLADLRKETPTITPEQVEQIIERVVDEVTADGPPAPPSTTGTLHPGPPAK